MGSQDMSRPFPLPSSSEKGEWVGGGVKFRGVGASVSWGDEERRVTK